MKTIYIVVVHGYGQSQLEFSSLTKALGIVSIMAKAGKRVEVFTKTK